MKRLLSLTIISLAIVFITYAASLALSDERRDDAAGSAGDDYDSLFAYSNASSSSPGAASHSSGSHTIAVEHNLSTTGAGAEGASAASVTIVSGDGTVQYDYTSNAGDDAEFTSSVGGDSASGGDPAVEGAVSVHVRSSTVVSTIVESHSPGAHAYASETNSVAGSPTSKPPKTPSTSGTPAAQPPVGGGTKPAGRPAATALEVAVAVAPGTINPGSGGKLRVIVYGATGLDTASIDPSTVKLSGSGDAQMRGAVADMNDDGHADALFYFDIADLALAPGTTELRLTGATTGGVSFAARASVSVVR